MLQDLIKIFDRDMERLKEEIALFQNEKDLWATSGNIINPAGNLCLHLVGNLSTFIGKNMGGHPYARDREAEFKSRDIARQELILQVEGAKDVVLSTLNSMTEEKLQEEYVENILGFPMSNSYFLMHLCTHFSYHLGQINYIRRMLE